MSFEALEISFKALESSFEALKFDFEAGFRRVLLGLTGFLIGLIVISNCRNFFWLSLAMLGLGERKGEKTVWNSGRWWVGVSDVVVVVGGRGGKNEEKMAGGGFDFFCLLG